MKLLEKKVNLFDLDNKYYLAHCISADAGIDNRAMGLGIVIQFNKKFHMKAKIKKYAELNDIKVGNAILIDRVFNLITKSKYYGKPTYDSLRTSLEAMKEQILNNDIHYLAVPKLGCGLDKLQWGRVRSIIQDVFTGLDLEILVCKL
ncbi:macro domain-containing protein [Clostridium sp. MT-14]|uniref:macro domain-containing protein n=1 Tax=Clostridium sp. MT-14 TaxID=3348360 RepID=UPI0035F3FC47